jgi:hypothetical protein
MSCMCQEIMALQRDIADVSTGELQHAIYRALDRMDMGLESMRHLCRSMWVDDSAEAQLKDAQSEMLMRALLVALCVRELTRRPAAPASLN